MRRRDFIAGLGSAAARPLVARGQQAAKAPSSHDCMVTAPNALADLLLAVD
jgi:hypothetical protein